jgi:RNA polymerase sigma factor (sigma-70 family)
MPTQSVMKVMSFLRQTACGQDGTERTDGDLLGEFVERRSEAAYEGLLRRHGRMVWGVCLRLLGHVQDAEDAFQATFLVLARKAADVAPRELVGNWLYGVAYQTAVRARATSGKRRVRERQVTTMPEPEIAPSAWDDLQPVLDAELSRLPEKYRAVLVLCDVEGRTRKEAARHLTCPEGSVSSRLARARTMLAKRLARRGLALSAAALATLLVDRALGSVPATLMGSTLKAAGLVTAGQALARAAVSPSVAVLTKGVLQTMYLAKLKTLTAVVLILGMLGLGSGLLLHAAATANQTSRLFAEDNKGEAEAAKTDLDKLQGLWQAVALEANGNQAPEEDVKAFRIRIKGNKIAFNPDTENREHTFTVDPKAKPKAMDLTPGDGPAKGQKLPCAIYELDGNSLKLCFDKEGKAGKRPSEFKTAKRDGFALIILKRVSEPAKEKDPVQQAQDELQGAWVLAEVHAKGRKLTDLEARFLLSTRWTFKGQMVFQESDFSSSSQEYRVDPGKKPAWLDFVGAKAPMVYRVDGDTLTVAIDGGSEKVRTRPSDLKTSADSDVALMIFKRADPDKEKQPGPKKLSRVPHPPPALQAELVRWDSEFRHGPEEKFAELERLADDLLKRYPEPDNQAHIYFQVAHVAGQSGLDKHIDRVRKYAGKALALSRDPVERGMLYSYLGSAAELDPALKTFEARRQLAADMLLEGYAQMLAQDLPEKAPDLPRVDKIGGGGINPGARAQHAAQLEAREQAEFVRALVQRRDTLANQLRWLYRPDPKVHGRNANGPNELRALATRKLNDPAAVSALLDWVTGPSRQDGAEEANWAVTEVADDLIKISAGSKSGLKTGTTLVVYRLKPNPVYLGQLRLVAVEESRAVGELTKKTSETVKVGDFVATRVLDQ